MDTKDQNKEEELEEKEEDIEDDNDDDDVEVEDKEEVEDLKEDQKQASEDQEPDFREEPVSDKKDDLKFKGFAPERKDFGMDNYQQTLQRSKSGSKKSIFLLILLILILLGGGWIILSLVKGPAQTQDAQTSSQTTEAPTTTPIPETRLDKSEWSFEILNGSGVTGAAGKLRDELIELGYSVVRTANADSDDYEQTQIYVREDLLDKVDLVVVDIKDVIRIASVAGELTDTDSTASARIIIGKE